MKKALKSRTIQAALITAFFVLAAAVLPVILTKPVNEAVETLSKTSTSTLPCAIENHGHLTIEGGTFDGYPCPLYNGPDGTASTSGTKFNK